MLASAAVETKRSTVKTLICDLSNHLGQHVTVHGWLARKRRTKAVRFLEIRDRMASVQVICRGESQLEKCDSSTPESAIRITGLVRSTADARYGTIEIEAESIEILAQAHALPQIDASDQEATLDYRYLNLRGRAASLIFEVQTTLEAAIRDYLLQRHFIEIHSPKITAGGSESGAAVFKLPYYGQAACLIQSPQFYMQLAAAAGFDRVFEVGPVFRAEEAITNRHASEFTCFDVELSWIDSHEELMIFEETLISHALTAVRDAHSADIERYFGIAVEVPETPIPRIPYSAACELTKHCAGESGGRLSHRAEQMLSKHVRERYGHSFVFITDYPATERPFYTMWDDGPESAKSRSFDLLCRGIEITSGCQREHRYDRLQARIAEQSDGSDNGYLTNHYLEMFKYGCPPHGGFGIGINRFLMALLGQQSIRETSFVFRGPGRFVP